MHFCLINKAIMKRAMTMKKGSQLYLLIHGQEDSLRAHRSTGMMITALLISMLFLIALFF